MPPTRGGKSFVTSRVRGRSTAIILSMHAAHPNPDELALLEAGRAVVVLDGWRIVDISGSDARGWLNDLLTADVASLVPGRAARSLLLSPTGRIRADVTIFETRDGGFAIAQSPDQPAGIDELLRPYILSSAVTVAKHESHDTIVAVPGSQAVGGSGAHSPSVLGPGWGLLGSKLDLDQELARLAVRGLVQVDPDAWECYRILRGRPGFPPDLDEDSLPLEAGLDFTIDFTKGCFLGQEAVAKVRNLGHPQRVIRHLRAPRPLEAGTRLFESGAAVGIVTSTTIDPRTVENVVLARVRWAAADALLATDDGSPLAEIHFDG
jgi:hypothetical protein